MEYLSDASFMGKLLLFPPNIKLDRKSLPRTNTLAYLATMSVTKEKSFITLTPGLRNLPIQDQPDLSKVECLLWSDAIKRTNITAQFNDMETARNLFMSILIDVYLFY